MLISNRITDISVTAEAINNGVRTYSTFDHAEAATMTMSTNNANIEI